MIILDTNVISELLRESPHPHVIAWIEVITDEVAITTITLSELYAGVLRLPDSRWKSILREAIDAAIAPYRDSRAILAFDDAAAREYGEVVSMRDRAGRPIATADAQIASICRVEGATCATRNVRDFEGTGVHVVNPWKFAP